jgi:hypothetical protein
MQLTKVQRQMLEQYRAYRGNRPGVGFFVRLNLWRYLLLVGAAVVAFLLLLFLGAGGSACLVLGLVAGALLRDIALFRRFKNTWPVTERVLDWERIDYLLEGRAPDEEAS